MHNLIDIIEQFVIANPEWSYFIIAALTLLQGEVAVFFAMYLVVAGDLSIWGYILATMGGVVIGENLLFFIGRTFRHTRFGWKMYRRMKANRRIQIYTRYLKEHTARLIVAGKFLVGINLFILFLTGWSKIKFRKFIKAEVVGSAIWLLLISLVAYSFTTGLHYLKSEKIFKQIEIAIALLIILVFVGEHFLKKFISRRMALEEGANANENALEEPDKKAVL